MALAQRADLFKVNKDGGILLNAVSGRRQRKLVDFEESVGHGHSPRTTVFSSQEPHSPTLSQTFKTRTSEDRKSSVGFYEHGLFLSPPSPCEAFFQGSGSSKSRRPHHHPGTSSTTTDDLAITDSTDEDEEDNDYYFSATPRTPQVSWYPTRQPRESKRKYLKKKRNLGSCVSYYDHQGQSSDSILPGIGPFLPVFEEEGILEDSEA